MTGEAVQEKVPLAVFAFFVWQSDLSAEITPAEADAFFRFLEIESTGFDSAARHDISHAYNRLWREYTRSGPLLPTALNQLIHHIDTPTRAALAEMLRVLQQSAPARKKRKNAALSDALIRLVNNEDAALADLQQHFRKSRFFTEDQFATRQLVAAEAVVLEEKKVTVVKETTVVSPVATETLTQATVTDSAQLIPVHKMVPWNELDAVSPERLQFWTKGTRPMRCIGIIDRSHDFRSFQFVSEEPTLFFYKPGQFVTLELTIDGKRYLRSYTISSSPSRPHLIEISVKRVKGGLVSNYLHDHLHIGDTVLMKPPGGKFHCFDTTTDKYLFLAAGSGVTPMLSMARWWHDTGAYPDVIFFHSIREPEDAVFTEEMTIFSAANRRFRYVASFTSPYLPEQWPGMKGRLTEEKLKQIAPDFAERMIFTCGPDSFMKNVKLILERNGFAVKERFRQESFGVPKENQGPGPTPITVFQNKPAAKPAAPVQTGDAVVHFSLSSLEVFGGDMDVPILDLAEEVGVSLPSSCRSGTCGTCRALKIHGDVECDDAPALTDADREAGYILTCVSRAKNYVELEV